MLAFKEPFVQGFLFGVRHHIPGSWVVFQKRERHKEALWLKIPECSMWVAMCYFGFRTFRPPALDCALGSEIASLTCWGSANHLRSFPVDTLQGPSQNQNLTLVEAAYQGGNKAWSLFPGDPGSLDTLTFCLVNSTTCLKNLITCSL